MRKEGCANPAYVDELGLGHEPPGAYSEEGLVHPRLLSPRCSKGARLGIIPEQTIQSPDELALVGLLVEQSRSLGGGVVHSGRLSDVAGEGLELFAEAAGGQLEGIAARGVEATSAPAHPSQTNRGGGRGGGQWFQSLSVPWLARAAVLSRWSQLPTTTAELCSSNPSTYVTAG